MPWAWSRCLPFHLHFILKQDELPFICGWLFNSVPIPCLGLLQTSASWLLICTFLSCLMHFLVCEFPFDIGFKEVHKRDMNCNKWKTRRGNLTEETSGPSLDWIKKNNNQTYWGKTSKKSCLEQFIPNCALLCPQGMERKGWWEFFIPFVDVSGTKHQHLSIPIIQLGNGEEW